MSNPSNLLIHVGYHKTGSSYLQNLILNNQSLGFYSPWQPKYYLEHLVRSNPFTYEPSKVREKFQQSIDFAHENGMIPVLSHEMLSGEPWKGDYNSLATAQRLKSTFPEAKILLIIREQNSMIESLYKHRVRGFFSGSIQNYLEFPGPEFPPLFRLDYLKYHWLIECYQSLFGKDRVLVLPYEMIRRDEEIFLKEIFSFSGNSRNFREVLQQGKVVNPGYSSAVVYVKRWFNLLTPNHPNPNGVTYQKLINAAFYKLNSITPKWLNQPFDHRLKSVIADTTKHYYDDSNLETVRLTGLELARYGYPLPELQKAVCSSKIF